MAWTLPRTWSPGETVTAAMMNQHLRDNLNILKTNIDDEGGILASKRFATDISDAATSGTGETDLHSFVIPANTLAIGDALWVYVWGTTDGNGNTKIIKAYCDTVQLYPTGNASANAWQFDFLVIRDASGTVHMTGVSRRHAVQPLMASAPATGAVDWSSDLTIKTTGQNQTSGLFTEKGMIALLLQ